MANANEKIIIQEDNQSTPKGAGASSDIAYVPGLTYDVSKPEYINRPVLCNTKDDLKAYFGSTPATVSADYTYGQHTVKKDSEDISYHYASQLLDAGLSVYYEAIVKDADTVVELTNLKTELANEKKAIEDEVKSYTKTMKTTSDPSKAAEIEQTIAEMNEQIANVAAKEAEVTATIDASNVEYLYSELSDRFAALVDLGEYSIKYITSGGYPTFTTYTPDGNGVIINTLATAQIDAAAKRGDSVAIIDHGDNGTLPLGANNSNSIYSAVSKTNWTDSTFATMFTPWATYVCPGELTIDFPASFAYLMCLARAIKTSPNYLAMAGVTRGQVPYIQKLKTKQTLTNVIAEDYQPRFSDDNHKVSINAITTIRPYGLTIWGNRTMEELSDKGTTAMAMLNTRNMVSDIKKVAYDTAKKLMFEQDGIVLWNSFKAGIAPLLDQLKLGRGISNYAIIRNKTKYNGRPLDRGELSATIKIYPVAAIEYFEITVAIADEEVSVS